MLPAPAIPASPSLPEPMRRAQAGGDPSSGQTGFPAALQAATEAAGEPAAAVPDPSSPPRLGRTMPPRPPAWRSAGGTPTGAFALAGAETSDTPATASPDAPTAGGASAALPAAAPADPHGGNVTEDDAASRPVAAADRSAAADPTIAIATKAGAAQQAGSAPRECVTASIAGAGSPASSRAAVRTRGPLPAYAGRAPAGSAADAPPHPARHPASALSIPPNVAAAAAMGVFGQMAALAGSAARAPACSSAAPAAIDTPPEQPFSSVDPSAGITSAPGPRQPGETGSQPCSGTGQTSQRRRFRPRRARRRAQKTAPCSPWTIPLRHRDHPPPGPPARSWRGSRGGQCRPQHSRFRQATRFLVSNRRAALSEDRAAMRQTCLWPSMPTALRRPEAP